MTKKLLFTTNHPAPYTDLWVKELKQQFDVSVLYNNAKSREKTWKHYTPEPGRVMPEMGVADIIQCVREADIIVFGGWNKWKNLFMLLTARLLRKKVAVFSDYPVPEKRYSVKWIAKYIFLRTIVPDILCATCSTATYYQRTFGYKQKHTITFPYAILAVPELTEQNTKREAEIKSGGKVHILITNNFQPRKGYDVLSAALAKLDSMVLSQISLTIAGHGECYDEFSQKIASVVPDTIFLGWIEQNEYQQQLSMCDVLIHASTFEPFGIPPIDAMKCGKAVIASSGVKSVDQIINDGENGFVFAAGNSCELADKITKAVTRKAELYEMGKRGSATARKVYNNCFCEILNAF